MLEYPRPFHKFIRTKQEINPHDRKLKYKGGDKTKGNSITPHVDSIADESEPAVPSGAENTGYQGGVDGSAHDVIGVDEQHVLQIMHGCFGKRGVFQYKGRSRQDQKTSQGAAYYGQLHQLLSIFPGIFQTVLPNDLAEQDTAGAGNSEAEDGSEVTHYDNEGIGGYRIGTQMADDDGIGGKSHSPYDVVSKGRKGKLDKILE